MNGLWCLEKKRWFGALLTAVFFFLLWGGDGLAVGEDKYPGKTIHVIVPQSPGGALDMEPRGFLPYLQKILGVDFLIENVPGAGGKMGLNKCWNAKPDGYTLLYHGIPQSIMSEYLFRAQYKTSEFTHVFALLNTNMILIVHPDNWKTAEEFIAAAREKTLTGGIPSPGSTSHVDGLILEDKLGLKINWIPYTGSGEVLSSVAGKHLDFAILSTNSAQAMVASGRVRPLLVFSNGAPDAMFPEVPYPEKLGYPITSMSAIRGFIAPSKTPSSVVKILNDTMFKVTKNADFRAWAKKVKLEITPLDGRQYLAETETQYGILENYKRLFKKQ